MDRKSIKTESVPECSSAKPILLATLVHSKSIDDQHPIIDCKRTRKGILGKRSSTYEMKVANFDTTYEGESVESDQQHGYEWVVALRNRRTGKTIFAPCEMVNFRSKREETAESVNFATKIDASNYEEMRRKLVMEFGHKKKKQALGSSLRNAVDEKSTGHLFAHAINYMQENEDVKKAKLDDEQKAEVGETSTNGGSPIKKVQLSTALPPCNLEAKKAADIYSIDDIVDRDLLDALKPAAEHFLLLTPKEIKDEGHPSLVMAIIQITSSIKDADERKKRVSYCLYLSYLIRLYNLIGGRNRYVQPSSLTSQCSIPQNIVGDLLNKFTSAGGGGGGESTARSYKTAAKFNVTLVHKDALLSRIVVLLLILSGHYAFNVNKALQDLGGQEGKVTLVKLTTICRALGCRLDKHQRLGEQICILEEAPKQKSALLKKQGFGGFGGKR